MNRDELIEIVADYAGPLGPFRHPKDQEVVFREALLPAGWDDFETLVTLLIEPPPIAAHRAVVEGWCLALEATLTIVGSLDPQRAVVRLGMVARKHGPARIGAISVLGELGEASALEIFGHLVPDLSLQRDEALAVACSLGQLGGLRATSLLGELAAHHPSDPALAEEIDTALEWIRTKGHSPRFSRPGRGVDSD